MTDQKLLERRNTAVTSDTQPGHVPARATEMQRAYAAARLQGKRPGEAAAIAGYSKKTVPAEVEARCIAHGILPDPDKATADLRAVVADLDQSRRDAREWLHGRLAADRDAVYNALREAAESGNVSAIKEALDRYLGPEPTTIGAGARATSDGQGGLTIEVYTTVATP